MWNGAVIVSLVVFGAGLVIWHATVERSFYLDITFDSYHQVELLASGRGIQVCLYKSPDGAYADDPAFHDLILNIGSSYGSRDLGRPLRFFHGDSYLRYYRPTSDLDAKVILTGFDAEAWPLIAAPPLPLVLWLILWHRNHRMIPPNHCRACRYNLTGTLAAGRTECPECGHTIPPPTTTP